MTRNSMRKALLLAVLGLGLQGFAAVADANVSVRNGNFFMAYTDAVYSGGFEMKIDRVYNSKASFKGMFGQGWGAEFEAHLTIDADGSITVHEFGGGAENRFVAEAMDPVLVARAVQAIKHAALGSRKIRPDDAETYQKRLETDLEFRNEEWEDLAEKGLVARMDLPVGTVLKSNEFGHQYIKRTRDGYARVSNSGKTEAFDTAGRLTRISDRNDNFIDLAYDDKGRLKAVSDDLGRTYRLTINKRGLVEKISDDRGREAFYQYNARDQLIQSTDVDKNQYRYEYDNRHNMTAIRYGDGTSLTVSYYGQDRNENIKSLKDRDGMLTTYDYFRDPKDPHHYGVRLMVRMDDGTELSRSSYEYFECVAADGTVWTSKIIEEVDGDRIETEYNESGSPLSISRGAERGSLQYDRKNRVTRKETATSVQELRYHEASGKVEYVKTVVKADPAQSQESWFRYDDRGNLVFAENSDKIRITLSYDEKGRVSDIVSGDDHLTFTYNAISKPEVISLKGVGEIRTTYDEDGNIVKVDRGNDPSIAEKVAVTMRTLLEVVRLAGVNLSL